jgi:hypothetical protein
VSVCRLGAGGIFSTLRTLRIVDALNIERIYTTTVPAEELARALADHFRGQGFEAQVFRTSADRTAMQARKESLWRNLLGSPTR